MAVEVTTFGRFHAGLIDLSNEGYRLNGGAGWSVDGYTLVVEARPASELEIVDGRIHSVSSDELVALKNMLTKFATTRGQPTVSIEVSGNLPSHRGFGAGTALRLAMLEACAISWEIDVARSELVAASGRGGTSGVGVNTYFDGGLVVDLGHRKTSDPGPSRDRSKAGAPRKLTRIEMPDWTFGVLSPEGVPAIDIKVERDLFDQVLPLATSEVRKALYEIIFGLVAGALDGDRDTFAAAVDALQEGAWKKAEWNCHGVELSDLAGKLRRAGAYGIGLSSMGPSIYFFGDKEVSKSMGASIKWVRPVNHGRVIRIIEDE
ncbi:MAG: beta-ribofuranosylaminobenzene 5'-phosphate synthase family protein [Pseudomonadota bacterium]